MAIKLLPRPRVNPRSLTAEERPWIEVWGPETHDELVDQLVGKLGLRLTVAWSIAGYIRARSQGLPAAIVDNRTKAQYRKYLRELAAAGVTPTPPATLRRSRSAPVRSEAMPPYLSSRAEREPAMALRRAA
jgi:hypothetical protein